MTITNLIMEVFYCLKHGQEYIFYDPFCKTKKDYGRQKADLLVLR